MGKKYGFEEDELLERFFDLVFDEQLNGWWTEKNDWPKIRDVATFECLTTKFLVTSAFAV